MSSISVKLSELGELGLLAELERRGLASGQDAEGAVLEGGIVVTQDVLVEGVHFRFEWTSCRDLGYKAEPGAGVAAAQTVFADAA